MTSNLKKSAGKAPLGLLPAKGLEVAAAAMEHGAGKYYPNNWKECDPDEVPTWCHAILRHVYAYFNGETHDYSGVHHLGHAAANALIALQLLGEEYQEPVVPIDPEEARKLVNSAQVLFGECPPDIPTSPEKAKAQAYGKCREGVAQ